MNDCDIIDSIRKVKKVYKMNSKTNYNYLNQASFLFCKYELMKLQLSMRRLRLVFVIFEILFENTEKLLYATKCKSIKYFFFTFQILQKLQCT